MSPRQQPTSRRYKNEGNADSAREYPAPLPSIVAIAPEVLNGACGGTTSFVLAFSLSLHKELAEKVIRVQAVLPGATATHFWAVAGTPVEQLPSQIVMNADDVVDAAIAGLDSG